MPLYNIITVTLELENDKIQEMPTLNNNNNASNNKWNVDNVACKSNKQISRYVSLYMVFQVFKKKSKKILVCY